MIVIAHHLHQASPTAAKADNLITLPQGAEGYPAYRRIQSRTFASAGQNPDDTFLGVDVSHNVIPRCSVENKGTAIIHSRAEFRKTLFRHCQVLAFLTEQ